MAAISVTSRRTSVRLVQVLPAFVIGEPSRHLLLRDTNQVVEKRAAHTRTAPSGDAGASRGPSALKLSPDTRNW
jgi:hypothetical protein